MKNITSKNGATILFVSHDLASLQMLCDRAIWIDKGKVVQDDVTLEVVKNYTESIRKSEEARQKAKNMKLSTQNKGAVDSHSDIYDTYLFRIVCDKEKIPENKIRKITLLSDKNPIAYINVGDAMDNNKEHLAHIIDDIGLMNWSESKKDDKGYYRSIVNNNSKYNHAPFQFSIEKSNISNLNIKLELECEYLDESELSLELYNNYKQKYVKLDKSIDCVYFLEPKKQINENFEEQDSQIETIAKNNINKRDIKYTEKCKILESDVLDKYGQKQIIFPYENGAKKFRFKVFINEDIRHIKSIFLIFSEIGIIQYSNSIEFKPIKGKYEYEIIYNLEEFNLGTGEYSISLGIYEDLDIKDNLREQKYIALLDRTLYFKIEEPLDYKLGVGKVVSKKLPEINTEGIKLECHSLI